MSDVDSVVEDGMRKQWKARIEGVLALYDRPVSVEQIADHMGETQTQDKTRIAATLHNMLTREQVFRTKGDTGRFFYSLKPIEAVNVVENSQGGTLVITPAAAKKLAESLFMPPPRTPLGRPLEADPDASLESGAGNAERSVPATELCAASAQAFWCAISSDGALQINAAAGALKLAAHELQALARFLERASLLIETLDRSGR
jgi:hypothetical protein